MIKPRGKSWMLPQRKKKPLRKRKKPTTPTNLAQTYDEGEEQDEEKGVAANGVGTACDVATDGRIEQCGGVHGGLWWFTRREGFPWWCGRCGFTIGGESNLGIENVSGPIVGDEGNKPVPYFIFK